MKIDSIYVLCNKRDFYFATICVASIRYWNKTIPVKLIKDFSNGHFATDMLEKIFHVSVVPTHIENLGYLSELYPFIEIKNERALVLDADIVWMGDLIPVLEQLEEDIVFDGYVPKDTEAEKQRWYFFEPQFSRQFSDYIYPGFFFNSGHILFSTDAFKKEEFLDLVHWEEYPRARVEDTFFTDQGILNYLVAEKIKNKTLTYKNFNFHIWGWDERVLRISVDDIMKRKSIPFLIHWFGRKNGLVSFLPGGKLLKFYESFYYRQLSGGRNKLIVERLKRTIKHFDKFVYELAKKIFYLLFPGVKIRRVK